MVESWFDFDEIAELEQQPEYLEGQDAAARPPAGVDEALALPSGACAPGAAHIVPIDDRTNAVLYIIQFVVPCPAQTLWAETGAQGAPPFRRDLGQGRDLVYFPNGVCQAMELDARRSVEPVRKEFVIHQTKCGSTMEDAHRIQTWEAGVEKPLLRFRTGWEFKELPGGKSTRVRCNLSEFEQYQNLELDLGQLVIRAKDMEMLSIMRKYGGDKAVPPDDYVVFSAPATAELLQAVSDGNAKPLPALLAKRADPNFACEPSGYDGELTPLMAAVRSGSAPCVRFLLEDAGADANVPCRADGGAAGGSAFCTALDVAEDPDLVSLLRAAGAVPMSELGSGGRGPNCMGGGVGAVPVELGEGVDAREFEAAIAGLSQELASMRRLSPGEQRGAFRRLLLQWHPDKNRERQALTTSVFQWLQQAALQVHRRSAGGVHWRTSAQPRPRRAPRSERPRRPPPKVQPGAVAGRMSIAMKICSRHWSLEFLELLVEQGESVLQLDDTGRSALFYAVRGVRNPQGDLSDRTGLSYSNGIAENCEDEEDEAQPDMISVMVEDYGADVNEADHAKMTPLMEAARFGNPYACQRLVQLRADISKTNSAGHSAIDIAEMRVPEYLSSLEAGSDTDGVWMRVQEAINRDRTLAANYLRRSLLHGNALGCGGGPRLQLK